MDKQKAIRLIFKFFVFTLAISSSVTVFAIISYANYTLFNDWLPTKIFTYIGSIGIAMATYYLVSTYLSKLINAFRPTPQAQFINCYKYEDPFHDRYREESKPSFLIPIKPRKKE